LPYSGCLAGAAPAPDAHEVLAGVVHDHAAAGMIEAAGLVDALDVALLVPREDVVHPHHAMASPAEFTMLHPLPGLSEAASSLVAGSEIGIDQAYFLPFTTMFTSRRRGRRLL